MGASYLSSILNEHSVLSVSHGKTVATTVQNLKPHRTLPGMKVVQLAGSLENTSNPTVDEMYTMQQVAVLYGCEMKRLFLPYLMDDEESRQLLLKRNAAIEIFRVHQEVDTFISGVDTLLYWTDHIGEKNVAPLMKNGAVGCMWGYFFDINGAIIETPLYDRMIIPKMCIRDRFPVHFQRYVCVLLYRHADLLCRADFPDRKARYDGHRLQPH